MRNDFIVSSVFAVFAVLFLFITGCTIATTKYQDNLTVKSEFEPKALHQFDYLEYDKNAPLKMVIQDAHSSRIKSIAFSPDGKFIASGSWDKTVKLWSIDGRLLKTFKGHTWHVSSIAFSPNGKIIASGSTVWDKTVKLWSIDGRLLKTLKGYSGSVKSVAFSPDGKFIASISSKKTIKLWNIDGRLVRTFKGHCKWVHRVAFSPNGKIMALAGETIELWSTDGRLLQTFKGHSKGVNSVAFSPDGKFIASGSRDKTIKLWTTDGRLIKTFKGHSRDVVSVAFSPDGKTIASGAGDQTVKLWSTDGSLLKTFKGHSHWVSSVAFSPDGKFIASGAEDQTIKLWSIDGGLFKTFKGHSDSVFNVAFSPDGKGIASTQGGWNIIKLWSTDGRLLKTLKLKSSYVRKIAFSPDGKAFASNLYQGIGLWSIGGKRFKTFRGHSSFVNSIAFSPDGKFIASGSSDKTIKLWSTDGRLRKTLKNPYSVESIAFSPDGKFIASGLADNSVRLWSIYGRLLRTIYTEEHKRSRSVNSIAFSPDGKTIASADDNTVKLWSIDGRLIKTFKGHSDKVNSIVFSPDGKTIASGAGALDCTVKLWSTNGRLLKTFEEHSDGVKSVVFSPDGELIVSGSSDNTIRMWNIKTGEHVALLSIGDDWFMYTPDGYFDSSRNGGKLVAMVKGLTSFSIDQFAIKNNRPDIILRRLGLGSDELINHYYSQYKRRLRRSGFTEAELKGDLHVPEAKIAETKQDGKFIEVSFDLSDSKYNLKKYNIYVNDVPLFGTYGKEITGNNFKKTERIELTRGTNKIEITTINEAGAESHRALTYADYNKEVKGDLYYIGFGVSEYKNSNLNLVYADKDATDLCAIFSKTKGKFKNIYIKTYLNEEVTVANIKKAKDLLRQAKVDDTFVLFIAGHGVYEQTGEATYYYLTYNADINNLSKTAANFDLIEDLFQGIAPRNKLFLMDTCESGEIDEDVQKQYYAIADSRGIKARTTRGIKLELKKKKQRKRTYLYQKERFIYNDLLRRSGAIVFSSSKGGEFSYESDMIENGFFTEEIINALTKNVADKDGDGAVSIDELRDYVSNAVAKHTGNKQHPTIDRDNIYQKFGFPLVGQ